MVTKKTVRIICLAAMLFPLVAVSLVEAAPETWPKAIAIASGRPGGGVYTIATGMASVITKYLEVKASAESGLFGKNIVLLHKGDVEFGMASADLAQDAARGGGDYEQYGKMNLRLMFSGSTPSAAFVVKAGSGIQTIQDLKGKTVMATMPPNMSFTRCADIILSSAGMTRKDLKDMTFAGPQMGREALAEGRVDAFISMFPSIGKTAWAEELNLKVPIRLITGDEASLEAAIRDIPFAKKGTFYAEYYGEMVGNKDMVSVGFPHMFLTRPDLPEDFVYEVMKLFFDHKEELYAFHLEAKAYLAEPVEVAVLPYHPGAIKYYKEKGLWTPQIESKQNALLKELGAK